VRRLPIILVTGEKGKNFRLDGLSAGADAVLLKPITSADLLTEVDRLLGRAAP
jgi:DNA-binding response OmpR family regulator